MSSPWPESVAFTPDRRAFLRGGLALPLAYLARDLPGGRADERGGRPAAGLIVRQKDPDNFEFPFNTLHGFITPNPLFYVRNHFPMPVLDARTWRLKVEGAVERGLELTYDQLKKLPARSVTATLECAGNGRSFLSPKTKGVQWDLGAVSTAEWTGVPLAAVLDRAGLKGSAVEVVLEGADRGEPDKGPTGPGVIPFARSLPLDRARRPEVLLAYRMNGRELPPAHGFPLRVVVPGWYGMASVKWLGRLVVADRPFRGFFQTMDYSYFTRAEGLAQVLPITAMQVKAEIARPAAGEVVKADADYRVHGAAWAGDAAVARVEVSTDGGGRWAPARLLDRPVRHCWRLWEYTWRTPARPGKVRLLARATDARGQTQPLKRVPGRRNYMISHVLPVEVMVQ